MNDDFEIDELASAYLDDAATADERARVDTDPALRARVDELRRVRDVLAGSSLEPPAAATRDSAVASALSISRAVDLEAERAERARRRVRIASIAAAAVLLIGAAGLLLRSATHDSSTKFSTVAAAPPPSPLAASSSQSEFAVSGSAGVYADREALVAAVQTMLRSPRSSTTAEDANAAPTAAGSTTSSRCATNSVDAASPIYTANATLEGAPVQIDVYALTDGSRRVVVTSAATCALVFTQPL